MDNIVPFIYLLSVIKINKIKSTEETNYLQLNVLEKQLTIAANYQNVPMSERVVPILCFCN